MKKEQGVGETRHAGECTKRLEKEDSGNHKNTVASRSTGDEEIECFLAKNTGDWARGRKQQDGRAVDRTDDAMRGTDELQRKENRQIADLVRVEAA